MEIPTSDTVFGIWTPGCWPMRGRFTFGEGMGSRFISASDVLGIAVGEYLQQSSYDVFDHVMPEWDV